MKALQKNSRKKNYNGKNLFNSTLSQSNEVFLIPRPRHFNTLLLSCHVGLVIVFKLFSIRIENALNFPNLARFLG